MALVPARALLLAAGAASVPYEEFLFPAYSSDWHGSPAVVSPARVLGRPQPRRAPGARAQLDLEVSPGFCKHANQSVVVVYLVQWCCMKTLACCVLRDYG